MHTGYNNILFILLFLCSQSFGIQISKYITGSVISNHRTLSDNYLDSYENLLYLSGNIGIGTELMINQNNLICIELLYLSLNKKERLLSESIQMVTTGIDRNPINRPEWESAAHSNVYLEFKHYIELPLIYKFIYNKISTGIGPEVLLFIKGKYFDVFKIDEHVILDTTNAINNNFVDYGASVYLGYHFSKKLMINSKYYFGFTNIDPEKQYRTKNRFIAIQLNYNIL